MKKVFRMKGEGGKERKEEGGNMKRRRSRRWLLIKERNKSLGISVTGQWYPFEWI